MWNFRPLRLVFGAVASPRPHKPCSIRPAAVVLILVEKEKRSSARWSLALVGLSACAAGTERPPGDTGLAGAAGTESSAGAGMSAAGASAGGAGAGGDAAPIAGGPPAAGAPSVGGAAQGGSPGAAGTASASGNSAAGGASAGGASASGASAGGAASGAGGFGGASNAGAGAGGAASGGSAAVAGNGGAGPVVPIDPELMSQCRTETAAVCGTTSGAACVMCTVDVANGNHDVTVEVGSATLAGASRVQSELYRISAPETATPAGESALLSFTVNVRAEKHDGYSAPGGKLDLIIDGPSPVLLGIGVAPAPSAVTIFVAGDSTVCDWAPTAAGVSSSNQRGWAQELSQYLEPGVAVANYADSGETAGGFYSKFWGDAKPLIKAGDYVFVQFGHNDQKDQATIDSYKTNLMRYVNDATAVGATPVIFTPVNRKGTSAGFEGLDQQARDLAADEGVALIDLTTLSIEYYRTQSNLNLLFAEGDGTHFSETGATAIAGLVANAIKTGTLPLKDYVR